MVDLSKDGERSFNAAKIIVDGRDPRRNMGEILVTAEHTIAAVLLMCLGGDARKAAGMLNEAFVQGVEQRLSFFQSKQG